MTTETTSRAELAANRSDWKSTNNNFRTDRDEAKRSCNDDATDELEEKSEAGHLKAALPRRRILQHLGGGSGDFAIRLPPSVLSGCPACPVPGSTYIHLQYGCVHSGFLLFPRLPFRSLARQPVSGVSAKSSALRCCCFARPVEGHSAGTVCERSF